jgi:Flp pilus assembly protein TadD
MRTIRIKRVFISLFLALISSVYCAQAQNPSVRDDNMIIKGDSLMNQKLYAEAIQAYQIALTTSKDKELILKYAHALHMNAEYKSEILAYEDLLNGTPNDMSILLKKGIALTSLGNLDDAITVYRSCLTIDSLKP